MTSKRAKGNAFQDQICKYLEKQGWVTHNQKTVAKWIPFKQIWTSQRNDIFGCLDILAVNGESILGIQATMHSGIGKKIADVGAIPWPYEKMGIEIWQKKSPRRWVIWGVTKWMGKPKAVVRGEIHSGKWVDREEP